MANVEIRFPSAPEADLSVRRFDVREGLSRPFEITLEVMSRDGDVDLERLAGQPATVGINRGVLGQRSFSGVCAWIEQRGAPERVDAGHDGGDPQTPARGVILYRYDVRVVPALWMLSQRRNHRIFQHQSTPEIVTALLGEWGIAALQRLSVAFPTHEYRVQWGESDLAFVSRLLEEAGISYFFDEGSVLVLADRPELAEPGEPVPYMGRPREGSPIPHITQLHTARRTGTGSVAIADFDFRRPAGPIGYDATDAGNGEDRMQRFVYAPGSSLIDAEQADGSTPAADDQSHARSDEETGYALARQRLQGTRGRLRGLEYATNLIDLKPGATFCVSDSPLPDHGGGARFAVTSARLTGDVTKEWSASGTAAFGGNPVRPEPSATRPRIDGLQSALVVGPDGQEIYLDELGRARVRFHWDRGTGPDDHRTCWLRCDEGWAGAGFGVSAPPRIGDEVLVSFYEGNPDQPVIVGRVHNAAAPHPNPLPASATRTTWRTRSTPGSDGYHELTLEDRTGRELVLIRSERDLETVVKREERETIGQDRVVIVGRHNAATIANQDTINVGQKHAVTMAQIGASNVGDAGLPDVTPTKTHQEIIAKRITMTTGGATIVLDGPEITITSERDIRIHAGGTVKIQGGPQVHINPPIMGQGGDPEQPKAPTGKEVWFKLTSDDGQPLAGVRCYVEMADGSTSSPKVTGGDGGVRFPVDGDGPYQIKLGRPPAEGADA